MFRFNSIEEMAIAILTVEYNRNESQTALVQTHYNLTFSNAGIRFYFKDNMYRLCLNVNLFND